MLFELRAPADRRLGDEILAAVRCCSLEDDSEVVEDNKIVGQLIHIVRSSQNIMVNRPGGKRSLKPQSSYDRILFFRDVVTGHVFAVFTENSKLSYRLLTTDVRIGRCCLHTY